MDFHNSFFWGGATSAYQIEGAFDADGKGLSVWDVFCRQAGKISGGDTGDRACNHYRLFQADVMLMKEIGLNAYRFSISWPRVMPLGRGNANTKGLDFYSRLADALLSCDIEPFVTLFHWDFPFELYRQGGWLNPDVSFWFADYATAVAKKLSDRVRFWITINEPQSFIIDGHLTGVQAPGDHLSLSAVVQAGHNALCSHGRAVQALRSYSNGDCWIGFAPVGMVAIPETDEEEDIKAAANWMYSMPNEDLWVNTWWMDPIYKGTYPEDGLASMKFNGPVIADGDLDVISQPLDFFAMNTYLGRHVRSGKNGKPEIISPKPGYPKGTNGNPITPHCLYWGPLLFYRRYKLPILISENGIANTDWVSCEGKVYDPQRIDFLEQHTTCLSTAIKDDVPILGYFYWSVMDDFEWENGYGQRFGLIHVDFHSQKRTFKNSAYWYRDYIQGKLELQQEKHHEQNRRRSCLGRQADHSHL